MDGLLMGHRLKVAFGAMVLPAGNDESPRIEPRNLKGFEDPNQMRSPLKAFRNPVSGVAGQELFPEREDLEGGYKHTSIRRATCI